MKKLTTEEFIERAKAIHGDKYDYSKSVYNGYHRLLTIICSKHGDFQQLPSNHIGGMGCKICSHCQSNTKEFIEKAKKVHGNKYDYSKVNYINTSTGVNITCPIHGDFFQTPSSHLNGCGCSKCAYENRCRMTTKEFIEKAKKVHGNKYDYNLVNYKNNHTKVCITCPEHGIFWQRAFDHLGGCGCPKCKNSHLEIEVKNCLISNLIKFEQQKTWKWLTYKSNQYVDFYLPDYNIVIECQGLQHFQEIKFFGGVEVYKDIKLRDENKLDLCTKNGIKILYYSNLGENFKYPYDVITDPKVLIDEIKKISLTN